MIVLEKIEENNENIKNAYLRQKIKGLTILQKERKNGKIYVIG